MLSLTADFRAYRERGYFVDCPNLPVPEIGQTVMLNRIVQDASGASVVIWKVAAYSPAYPLPQGSEEKGRSIFAPAAPSGLVVVLAEPAFPKPKKDFDYKDFDYDVITADDSSGSSLLTTRSAKFALGDALSGTSPTSPDDLAQVETVYLQLPTPEARTFALRLYRETALRLNQRELLAFPSVPAPTVTTSK